MLSYFLNNYSTYKLILCGDFNINLLNSNNLTKTFLDILVSFDLDQTIFLPTRVAKKSSTLLDNIFVNFNLNLHFASEILQTSISDDYAQTIYIKKSLKKL